MSRAIRNLQDFLRARGYDPGPTDGIHGPRTDAAIRRYQKDRNLTVDGIAGPETMTSLIIDLLLPLVVTQPAAPDPVALIAQAVHETGYGLAMIRDDKANRPSWNWWNLKGTYNGCAVNTTTWEFVDGRKVVVSASFRVYPDQRAAMNDYLQLVQGVRYVRAWAVRQSSLAYIEALRAAGYATDPDYTRKVAGVAVRVALQMPAAPATDWQARALAAEAKLNKIREIINS